MWIVTKMENGNYSSILLSDIEARMFMCLFLNCTSGYNFIFLKVIVTTNNPTT